MNRINSCLRNGQQSITVVNLEYKEVLPVYGKAVANVARIIAEQCRSGERIPTGIEVRPLRSDIALQITGVSDSAGQLTFDLLAPEHGRTSSWIVTPIIAKKPAGLVKTIIGITLELDGEDASVEVSFFAYNRR